MAATIIGEGQSQYLVKAATGTIVGSSIHKVAKDCSFQAILTTTSGTGSATITIQVSLDGSNWCSTALGTITHTSVASGTSDGFTSSAPWRYVRASISSVSGTGTSVDVLMGT